MDTSFLKEYVGKWETLKSFQEMRETIKSLKCTNDKTERDVSLATTFAKSITRIGE